MDPYCDYCEQEGHAFRSCPKRDDEYLGFFLDAESYED